MNMSVQFVCLSVLMVSLTAAAVAMPFTSSPEYEAKIKQAENEYTEAKKLCNTLTGNEKNLCAAEAKADEKRSKADATAEEKATPEAKTDALIAHADADLDVAKVKCALLNGNPKSVCIKRAEAEHEQSVSIAKANQKVREAHEEALDSISEAAYELEIEKCNALSGSAKDACISNVKANFSK